MQSEVVHTYTNNNGTYQFCRGDSGTFWVLKAGRSNCLILDVCPNLVLSRMACHELTSEAIESGVPREVFFPPKPAKETRRTRSRNKRAKGGKVAIRIFVNV